MSAMGVTAVPAEWVVIEPGTVSGIPKTRLAANSDLAWGHKVLSCPIADDAPTPPLHSTHICTTQATMSAPLDFKDLVVIVTGGGGGLGRA